MQHRLELTKLEAEREVAAARDQVELANLEAYRREGGIKWSPERDVKDTKPQPSRVPTKALPSVIDASKIQMTKPSHTSTPALGNAQTSNVPLGGNIRFRVPRVSLNPYCCGEQYT